MILMLPIHIPQKILKITRSNLSSDRRIFFHYHRLQHFAPTDRQLCAGHYGRHWEQSGEDFSPQSQFLLSVCFPAKSSAYQHCTKNRASTVEFRMKSILEEGLTE